jgi:hypothetical protein
VSEVGNDKVKQECNFGHHKELYLRQSYQEHGKDATGSTNQQEGIKLLYFSIDNARYLYKKSKFVKNEHGQYIFARYKYYLIFIEH